MVTPSPSSLDLKRRIINDATETMSVRTQKRYPCGPCGRACTLKDLRSVNVNHIDWSLLRNDTIPHNLNPVSYNFEAYGRALLVPESLSDRTACAGHVSVCSRCWSALQDSRTPDFALCNGYYYAADRVPEPVRSAFVNASVFELMLISRVCGNTVTFKYSNKPRTTDFGRPHGTSQSYMKGNVMVLPQDVLSLNNVLPPGPVDVAKSVVVLCTSNLSRDDHAIRSFKPVQVSPDKVRLLVKFLLEHNPAYSASEAGFDSPCSFSDENCNALVDPEENRQGTARGLPPSVMIGHLTESDPALAATASYDGREFVSSASEVTDSLLVDTVGWTDGDVTNVNYERMKLSALSWCLHGNSFIRSVSGSTSIQDFNCPRLLTWMWPKLDPFGLGSFGCDRFGKTVTLRSQVRHLLSLYNSPFATDSTFAFVCHNIIRKQEIYRTVRFRVKVSERTALLHRLSTVSVDSVCQLEQNLRKNPAYVARSSEERAIQSVVRRLGLTCMDLPGTPAYKLKCRNEVRSMCNVLSTPALYITINPFDRAHPLVRLLSGDELSIDDAVRGDDDTGAFRRSLLAANNPVATATFFRIVMESFIHDVLRYGKDGQGLFG
ncbi:hypothetical protein CALVIDRAFT_475995, partial [Calocera viscosa TUFC12733]